MRVKGEGAQPLLVFSDGGRSMALVVDEIVDIVEDRLDIEVGERQSPASSARRSSRARRPRSSMSATSCRSPSRTGSAARSSGAARTTRTLLLVDDSPFFRNMLTPVLKAAGYRSPRRVGAQDALALLEEGPALRRHRHRHRDAGHGRLRARRGRARRSAHRRNPDHRAVVDDLAPKRSSAAASVGFHDYVAKFDRQGLIAALKEQTDDRSGGVTDTTMTHDNAGRTCTNTSPS